MASPSREKYTVTASGKTRQDAVYWINLARAQDKGDYLQFWQTRSHARIVCSSVPADCIYKAISQKGERILFERLSTSRPAPKIVLKSAWQSQQQQQQQQDTLLRAPGNWCKKRNKVHLTDNLELPCVGNLMRSTESPVEKEESEFKVDFRIEGIRCDPGRWTDNGATSKRSGKLRTGFRTKSIIEDLEKPENPSSSAKSRVVQSRTWQYWDARTGTDIQNRPVPFLLEAHTRGMNHLRLRHLSSTWWGTKTKNQSQIPDCDSSLLPCTSELLKR